MRFPEIIDLHLHSTVSDGTDTPEAIIRGATLAGLDLFSVTDHDDVKGCRIVKECLKEGDPLFVDGVELSCKDEDGKYHILGYAYDIDAEPVKEVIRRVKNYRMDKVAGRLAELEEVYGFTFPEEEIKNLYMLDNPGKPHIGNLMVKYGYASDRDEAIKEYINKIDYPVSYLRPEEAIDAIRRSGGVSVLAHPFFGSGDQYIKGKELDERIARLRDFGLEGVEAYYSQFTESMRLEILSYAKKYHLYVSAGSDYHGRNRSVSIGETHLDNANNGVAGLHRFLERILEV